MSKAVCVTGLGCVSPAGIGVGPLWEAVIAPRSCLSEISAFDASDLRNARAGIVRDELPGELPRIVSMVELAVEEALGDRGAALPPERTGICLATNFGPLESIGEDPGAAPDRLGSCDLHSIASRMAQKHRLDGPCTTLSLSCASGAAAIGYAARLIERGLADRMIAGGFDGLTPLVAAGLSALRAVTTEEIRPFDARRSGTILGEGAAVVILEREEGGTRARAGLLGWCINNDAFHMTAPERSGRGMIEVMRGAIDAAGLGPGDIDAVSAHGTGTVYNDVIETTAVKQVLGERAAGVPVFSTKPVHAHTMGAAGAMETIICVRALEEQFVPPTMNLEEPDERCDLDYVPAEGRAASLGTVLNNSYGIGGANACLVLRGMGR